MKLRVRSYYLNVDNEEIFEPETPTIYEEGPNGYQNVEEMRKELKNRRKKAKNENEQIEEIPNGLKFTEKGFTYRLRRVSEVTLID